MTDRHQEIQSSYKQLDKVIEKYAGLYRKALIKKQFTDVKGKTGSYKKRLKEMYQSDVYKKHNVYPTMQVELIYAVIAMCLELKNLGLSDGEIIEFTDVVFEKRKKAFALLEKVIDVLWLSASVIHHREKSLDVGWLHALN